MIDTTFGMIEETWLTSAVIRLANLINAGDTELIPSLGDALSDAGCTEMSMIDHCRSGDCMTLTHPLTNKGCWVVYSILQAHNEIKKRCIA